MAQPNRGRNSQAKNHLITLVLALIIGIVSGTYSSIFVASPLWYDMSMKSKKKRF